ncbi:MAG: response regulator transcription factor [Oscillospiraceae bacterium]|nr:response regulator transcription factor [Oscillospiraceae bacterium]
MDKKILVVDDEKPIVDILRFNLQKEGYGVIEAYDGEEAVKKAADHNPDLILLDVMLPKLDGFGACKKIREKQSTPILMLTAREEEVDKVLGLELGADDYITKPFSVRELMARIRANMRRNSGEELGRADDVERIDIGEFVLDCNKYELFRGEELIYLTVREFELLKFFSLKKDKIFSRESLLEQVWGYEYYGDVRTVDVTVRRLREKMEEDPSNPQYIKTKRGVGYYLAK